MNISEEKKHIYQMMDEITKERRELTGMYFGLKQRLDNLHELEQRGLEDLDIKGYADMRNEVENHKVQQNLIREMENLVSRVEKIDIDKLEQPRPQIDEFEISEQRYRDNVKSNADKKPAKKKEDKLTTHQITKEIRHLIPKIMKDYGKPMKSGEVYDILISDYNFSEDDIDIKNFRSNQFYRTIKERDDIEKVDKGMYQLISKDESNNEDEQTENENPSNEAEKVVGNLLQLAGTNESE